MKTVTYEQQRFLQGKIRIKALQNKPDMTEEDKYEVNGIKLELWRLIMNFAYTEMARMTANFAKPKDYYADIIQGMACIFYERLPYYDPLRCTPTTYFVRYFRQVISSYIHTDLQHRTQYDSMNIRIVTNAIDYYEKKNITWNEEMISLKSGLSMKIVKNSLYFMANSVRVNLDDPDENTAATLKSKAPSIEKIAVNKDTKRIIKDSLDRNLTDRQQKIFLLWQNPSGTKARTYREAANMAGMSQEEFKKELNGIIQILSQDTSLMGLYKASE